MTNAVYFSYASLGRPQGGRLKRTLP